MSFPPLEYVTQTQNRRDGNLDVILSINKGSRDWTGPHNYSKFKPLLRDEVDSLNCSIVKPLRCFREEPHNIAFLECILATIEQITVIGMLLGDEILVNNSRELRKHYQNPEGIINDFDNFCRILYEIDTRLDDYRKGCF